MKKYSAIIADDEENLCHHLKTLLSRLWPELQITGIAYNGLEALSLIRQEEPDIAFLDIKMPVLSGIDVAMRTDGASRIVFVTAYDEFAIQAFEQNALDYLLKPVTQDRLEKTIERLKNSLALTGMNPPDWQVLIEKLASAMNAGPGGNLQWIRAGKGDKIVLVPVEEIIFCKSSDKYTSVITKQGEHLIRKPIKELAIELDKRNFWQINRGLIVNVNRISSTRRELNGRCKLRLKDHPETLVVSRKYAHLFRQM